MPARSQAQRAYLAEHMGVAWMRRHGFANKGPLPEHVPPHPDMPHMEHPDARRLPRGKPKHRGHR